MVAQSAKNPPIWTRWLKDNFSASMRKFEQMCTLRRKLALFDRWSWTVWPDDCIIFHYLVIYDNEICQSWLKIYPNTGKKISPIGEISPNLVALEPNNRMQ